MENPPLNCAIDLADLNINVVSAPSINFSYNTPTANLGTVCSGDALDIALNTDALGIEGVDYVFIVDAIRYETPTSGDGNVAPPGGLAGYGPLNGGALIDGMDNIVMGSITESLENTTGDQVRISYRVFTRLLGSGCEGNSAWINGIVDPEPVVSLSPTGPFCIDDVASNLMGSPAGGIFSGSGITDTNAGTFDPATAGLGSHVITYTFTDPSSMCSGAAEITIVVGPEIDFAAAGPFCVDASAVNLLASPGGGMFSGNGITDANAGIFDPAIAGVGTYTIDYTYTDPISTCTGTASITIQVNALPVLTLTPVGPLCTNDAAFDLMASPSGGTFNGNGITDANAGTFDPALGGAGSQGIDYNFTDVNGCSATTSINIIVNTAPTLSLAPAGPFCIDDTPVNLNGTPSGGIYQGSGITDAMAGTFDPATAGLGTHLIRYFLTDANNCTDTTSIAIMVNSCQDPTITNNDPSIDDPCSCIGNGQFSEEVLINSDPGETWTITTTTLIDPNTMMSYPPGFVIPETPVGSGRYILNGIHLDGIGYTLTAGSAMQAMFPLSISNTCYYPDPVIEALTGYCMDADPVTVVGRAGGEVGTGNFVLNNTPLPTFEVPAGSGNWQATFDPSSLIITTHTLTFTFDADTVDFMNNDSVACVASVSQQFEISGDQGDLECAALINVSVGADCMATLDPDVILQGNDVNNDLFLLEIFVNGQSIGNTVNGNQVGDTLEVRVTDLCSAVNNFCWGNIFVEDKIDPVLDCQPVEIWCNEDPRPSNPLVGFPSINDSCDPNPDTSFVDVLTDFSCTESALYSALITRTWTVCDGSNNCTTCDQEIFLRRAMTADITLPPNFDNIDQPAFSCSDPTICLDPTLACTGVPTINGIPADGGSGFCELNVVSSDDTLFVDAGSFTILRTWTIVNWCNSNDILQEVQVIKVEDDEAPTITCPANFTAGTSANACEAIVILPAAQVSDNCSPLDQITVETFLGNQPINGNGGSLLLPLGMHTITYVATDDSGNSSSCDVQVTVVDDIIPVAVCNADITVALTLNEPTLVNAITFDDGSDDNCSVDLQFAARRMDSPSCPGFNATDFAATVPFFCCDVGNVVMVELQVMDEVGNSNTCMVEVQVQDKLAPALICPSHKTIDCSDDLTLLDGVSDDPSGAVAFFVELTSSGNDTTFVGYYADVFDNCSAVVYIKDEGFLDNCGISVDINGNPAPYNRIYVAVDPSGNVRSCTQQITVANLNPFQLSDISFPTDITLDGCLGANIDPSVTGRPIYSATGCSIIADTLKDQTFTFVDGVCVKILRTWTVIDWCTFDASDSDFNDIPEPSDDGIVPGYFQDLQIIKVLDTEAPQITSSCNNISFDGQGPACNGFANLQASADDCAPDAELSWTYRIDVNNDGSFDNNGMGNDASGIYPVGTHRIEWTVEDGCGNSSSCDYLFSINDALVPQATCINETLSLVAPSNEGVLWASDVIIESGTFDNCPGNLTYSFSPNTIQTGMTFNCDSLGDRTVRVYVTDASGNQTACTSINTVQANAPKQCQSAPMASVSGSIKDEEGEEVQYVEVDAGYGLPYTTDIDGLFLIDSLPMHANYMVSPERNDDPLNGVSTYDIVLMSMHILGLQPLDSPYKIIAADVNRSGEVTGFDMVELRKLILFINLNFTNNTSWRFVDESFLFPDPTNPFLTIFPEEYLINDLENSMTDVDFVAIKTGDLNNSASPHELQGGDTRTDGSLKLVVEEQDLRTGQEYSVPIYAKDIDQLYGYQLTLGFDSDRLELLEVESGALPNLTSDNFGWQFVEEGILTSSWASPQAQKLEKELPLFYLKIKAKQNGMLSSMLYLNPRYTPAEAYAQLGERLTIDLAFDRPNSVDHSAAFALYQNRPNPFKDETVIGFTLPTATSGSLRIYDVSGRLLKLVQGQFAEGYNEVVIDQSELQGSGLLYYQLDTPTHTATKKMTLLSNE
ncbi:MAG: HYR domain-containing protein [Bacteroidota bacterium]